MSSGTRIKASQKIGRPITWAQLNLEAAEDLQSCDAQQMGRSSSAGSH